MIILNLSWGSALAFSVVFSKFSEYLVMIMTVLVYLSDHESFLVLYIWEALLYFDHCENSKKMFFNLFVLAWKCFVPYDPLYCRHLIKTGITWLTFSCLHLSFRVGFHIITMYYLLFCGDSKINKFLNKLLFVIFRVLHY